MQRTAILNGSNINFDKDYSLTAVTLMEPGVVEGLQVTENSVAPGKAFIQVERTSTTPSERFYIVYENTTAVTIDTSGTKKVFVRIPKVNINDPAYNSTSQNIAVIETGDDYPTEDYIALASITAGVITDARIYAKINSEIIKKGNVMPLCSLQVIEENYEFTGMEKNNTGFSCITTDGDITVTLDLSLFPSTHGMYEFKFCKSTSDTNKIIIDVGTGNTIDGSQTYEITSHMEVVIIAIVNSTFAKVIGNPGKSTPIDISSQTETKTLNLTDEFIINRGGNNFKINTQNIFGKSAVLDDNLSFGQLVRLIIDGTTVKLKNLYETVARTIGTGATFSTNNPTEKIGVAKMGSNKFIVAYRKGNTSYAKVGVVTGNTIAYTGNEVSWMPSFSETSHSNKIAEIDTDKFAVSIMTGSLYPAITVGTVSGSTITVGSTSTVSTNSAFRGIGSGDKIIKIDTNKFVWFWCASGGQNYAVVGTVSGTTCTFGAIQTVQASGSNTHLSGCKIANNKVLLTYRKASDTFGYYRICTVSGTALTLGTETLFNSGDSQHIDATQVLDDKCLITYTDIGFGGFGTIKELSVSGTTGTLGTGHNFNTTNTGSKTISLISLFDGIYNFGISFIDITDSNKLKYQRVSFNAGSFTNGTIGVVNNASTTDIYSADIFQDKVVCVYKDTATLNNGIAKVVFDDRTETGFYRNQIAGIIQEDGVIGETKTYMPIGGISGTSIDLTVGVNYYIQEDGSIGTAVTNIPIGKAIAVNSLNTGYKDFGLTGETSTTATTGSVTLGNAVGYITTKINGNDVKIPYYNT